MLTDAIERAIGLSLAFTGTHNGSSYWQEYRRCARAHRLRYKDGVRPAKDADYFGIGTIFHGGLAFAATGELEGFQWKIKDYLEAVVERKLYEPDVVSEAQRLLAAYFGQWGTELAGYAHRGHDVKILEIEHFTAAGIGGRYTGRIDALLEFDGRLLIVDHKTSARMPKDDEETLANRWRTKPQFLGLAYCVREVEREAPLFMVNHVAKTQIPGFRRVVFEFSDAELDRWADEHRAFVEAGLDADWMNYSECAPEIGQPCWAFNWCHGTDEQRRTEYIVKSGRPSGSSRTPRGSSASSSTLSGGFAGSSSSSTWPRTS